MTKAVVPSKQFLGRLLEVHVVLVDCSQCRVEDFNSSFKTIVVIGHSGRKIGSWINTGKDSTMGRIRRQTRQGDTFRGLLNVLSRIGGDWWC